MLKEVAGISDEGLNYLESQLTNIERDFTLSSESHGMQPQYLLACGAAKAAMKALNVDWLHSKMPPQALS